MSLQDQSRRRALKTGAALAGAGQGRAAASAFATANKAQIRTYVADGWDVTVSVERDGIHATARARVVASAIP